MIEVLYILSAAILGIFAGTQIAEGALLVPYWKSLAPQAFFKLHKTYGPIIHRFFAPLTIGATVIPLVTAVTAYSCKAPGYKITIMAAVLSLMVLATFFIYFKKANQSFADVSITNEQLPVELSRWGNWHCTRVIIEVIAFILSLIAVLQL